MQVLVVNAPRVFASAWSLIAPLLPKRSRDKVATLVRSPSATALLSLPLPPPLPQPLSSPRAVVFATPSAAEYAPF